MGMGGSGLHPRRVLHGLLDAGDTAEPLERRRGRPGGRRTLGALLVVQDRRGLIRRQLRRVSCRPGARHQPKGVRGRVDPPVHGRYNDRATLARSPIAS